MQFSLVTEQFSSSDFASVIDIVKTTLSPQACLDVPAGIQLPRDHMKRGEVARLIFACIVNWDLASFLSSRRLGAATVTMLFFTSILIHVLHIREGVCCKMIDKWRSQAGPP